jgi:hypothetical protein
MTSIAHFLTKRLPCSQPQPSVCQQQHNSVVISELMPNLGFVPLASNQMFVWCHPTTPEFTEFPELMVGYDPISGERKPTYVRIVRPGTAQQALAYWAVKDKTVLKATQKAIAAGSAATGRYYVAEVVIGS